MRFKVGVKSSLFFPNWLEKTAQDQIRTSINLLYEASPNKCDSLKRLFSEDFVTHFWEQTAFFGNNAIASNGFLLELVELLTGKNMGPEGSTVIYKFNLSSGAKKKIRELQKLTKSLLETLGYDAPVQTWLDEFSSAAPDKLPPQANINQSQALVYQLQNLYALCMIALMTKSEIEKHHISIRSNGLIIRADGARWIHKFLPIDHLEAASLIADIDSNFLFVQIDELIRKHFKANQEKRSGGFSLRKTNKANLVQAIAQCYKNELFSNSTIKVNLSRAKAKAKT